MHKYITTKMHYDLLRLAFCCRHAHDTIFFSVFREKRTARQIIGIVVGLLQINKYYGLGYEG